MTLSNQQSMNNLSKMFIKCVILVLLMSAEQVGSNSKIICNLLSDIVFAVDTTSSQNPSDFDTVKSEVKKIAENFTIGQTNTRLALLSIANTASVVVNFNAVNSLAEFTAAVDKLLHSTETADLSEGIKVSKDSVLDGARPKASKILILVKDRRSAGSAVNDNKVLSQVTSEAKRVTNLKATINVVGIGGLWSTVELEAIYGPEYLLFKGQEKALASIKKFNDKHCEAACPLKGTKTPEKQGLCYGKSRHKIHSRVLLAENAAGVNVCRKEIVRQFESCTDANKRCNNLVGERTEGKCDATTDEIKVDVTTDYFVTKEQACKKQTKSNSVKCAKINECPEQVADIVFILDRSGSISTQFPTLTDATVEMVTNLNIGKYHVKVGVLSFNDEVHMEIKYGEVNDKDDLQKRINGIHSTTYNSTNTHLALEEARKILLNSGRNNVAKFVILITDGESNQEAETLKQARLLKENKIELYVIGVAKIKQSELEAMTAPETKEKMHIIKQFSDLKPWSQKFSKTLCLRLSPPAIELCHDNVFVQSVTDCQNGVRYILSTRYQLETIGGTKCIKSVQAKESSNCNPTCLSPTDGNEFIDGDNWQSLCYTFKCENNTPKVVKSQCMASDGSCKDINAPPFKCLDESNKETNNCQCVQTSDGATLAIEMN